MWNRIGRQVASAGAASALAAAGVHAQVVDLEDPRLDYYRLLQVSGWEVPASFTVLPSLPGTLVDSAGRPAAWGTLAPREGVALGPVTFDAVDAWLRGHLNTTHPFGRNDGVLWRGKGLTTALDVGTTVRWRWLTLDLRPTVLYAQNEAYRLAPVSVPGQPEVAYPWRRIDLPQRFGTSSLTRIHPGQSELSVLWRGVRGGVSTKNLWWGPGRRNAIVMSNNAPGFPHAFLGTSGPVDVGAGLLEARWIWGRLEQSDWFDPSVTKTDRFLTGAVVAYSPSFFEGLTVGVTRLYYGLVPDSGVPLGDLFLVFQGVTKSGLATDDNPLGNDDTDQMISLFWRWVASGVGLEFYGEWARNDHSWDFVDFLLEPEHSQAYTLGLQKAVGLRNGDALSLWFELTHLERSRTVDLRASPVYYTHHIVTQGYTHDGQVVGAGIGPGGNTQAFGADLYRPWGRVGVYVQRDAVDNDAYYAFAEANDLDSCCHHVEARLGARASYFQGPIEWGGSVVLTREYNRYFSRDESWNLSLGLSARYRPR